MTSLKSKTLSQFERCRPTGRLASPASRVIAAALLAMLVVACWGCTQSGISSEQSSSSDSCPESSISSSEASTGSSSEASASSGTPDSSSASGSSEESGSSESSGSMFDGGWEELSEAPDDVEFERVPFEDGPGFYSNHNSG